MIEKEQEVCQALNLPTIPKKKWDGQKSFKTGVAVVSLGEMDDAVLAYAVATFDAERGDEKPRITKVFTTEQFFDIKEIYIVPDYMDDDVENMDLDDESKAAAQRLLDEAKELEGSDSHDDELPKNEYFFDHVHNDDEAVAFIKSYNSTNKIRGGKVPTTHERIIMRLSVIYSELNSKSQKSKSRKKK